MKHSIITLCLISSVSTSFAMEKIGKTSEIEKELRRAQEREAKGKNPEKHHEKAAEKGSGTGALAVAQRISFKELAKKIDALELTLKNYQSLIDIFLQASHVPVEHPRIGRVQLALDELKDCYEQAMEQAQKRIDQTDKLAVSTGAGVKTSGKSLRQKHMQRLMNYQAQLKTFQEKHGACTNIQNAIATKIAQEKIHATTFEQLLNS